nr:MAG TPA: hypothetical protein [Bacteriophage sp.]
MLSPGITRGKCNDYRKHVFNTEVSRVRSSDWKCEGDPVRVSRDSLISMVT